MDEQERRIAECIREFDSQGWHRTGTDVDEASGRWLAERIRALGLETELEAYALSRVSPAAAYVEIEGRRIAGLPLFDGGFTGAEGISGQLGGDIAVVTSGGEASAEELARLRRDGSRRALVLVTRGRRPGLMAHNATDFNQPFGPPVLQVSGDEGAWLERRAGAGARATVVAQAERVPAESANVVARRPGIDAGPAPVMVTTPRSGWWHCASERGGGIAAWLEVARRVTEARPPAPVWFVAFSGHELGHLGSDAFLQRRPEMVKLARAWVHFGANVGGATEAGVRASASDQELLSGLKGCLDRGGVGNLSETPAGRVLGLESGDISRRGGTCASVLGGNAFFHLESDRWPQAVDVAAVARQANAVSEFVLGLAGRRG